MELESDSIAAVNIINNDDKVKNYPERILIVQGKQIVKVIVPTNELVQLLKTDMQGIIYSRSD